MSGPDKPREPVKELRCKRCDATLCSFQGSYLILSNGARVVGSAELQCHNCGFVCHWNCRRKPVDGNRPTA